MKKKGVYIIIGLLILFLSIFAIKAIVDKLGAWHSADEILITINNSYTMTLQEAIDNNVFVDGATQSYTTEVPNPGHDADEIWVSVEGDEKTLQTAIDELSTSDGLCKANTLLCKPICNFAGTFSECWYDPCARECIGGLCDKHKALCEEIGFSEEGWYDSNTKELIILGNCAYESPNAINIKKGQFADEIEVTIGIVEKSFQEAIDDGDFCPIEGLIVYYPFNGNTNDESGNGNNGIASGGSFVADKNAKPNSAYEFDGGAFIDVPTFSLTTDTITIVTWINTNSISPYDGLIFSRSGSLPSGFNINGNGNGLGYHWNDDPSTYNWDGGPTIPLNEWVLVALVVEPSKATTYLRSTSGMSSGVNSVSHSSSTLSNLELGKDSFGERRFYGVMDEVRIYSRALPGGEIEELYCLQEDCV